MNNFLDLVQKRQSVRKYIEKTVEKEKIETCLQAAMLAPSACNAQPWKYIVEDKPEIKDKVAKACYSALMSFNKFVEQAANTCCYCSGKSEFYINNGTSDQRY